MASSRGKLDGRVAVITGGARGQGEADARLFVAEGARVVIGDILDEVGVALAAELGNDALFLHLDVANEHDWRSVVDTAKDRYGGIDVLVNNAGIPTMGPLAASTLEDFRRTLDVNLVGAYLGMMAVYPHLVDAGGGSIINTSSAAGLAGMEFAGLYSATKFAIRGLTRVAAFEWGSQGIRVNAIVPGIINTAFTVAPGSEAYELDAMVSGLPIERMGDPHDIARMALFLASDDSAYCTGAEYLVDGGLASCIVLPPTRQ